VSSRGIAVGDLSSKLSSLESHLGSACHGNSLIGSLFAIFFVASTY
jgi:hypothetical protein